MAATEELLDQGLAHHQAGRLAEAANVYLDILRAAPRDANALHLLGVVRHQQGQHDTAVKYIRQALDVQPRSESFWANLAAVYQALQRHQDVADAWRQVLRLNPNHVQAHLLLGKALHAHGDLPGALGSFQQASRLDPNSAEAHVQAANVQRKLGRFDEAVHCYQKALAVDPNRAEVHFNLGYTLSQQDKPAEAARSYAQALKLDPNYAAAHHNLGVMLTRLGNLEDAAESHRAALALNPEYADAHRSLGLLLLRWGEFEAGWSHYEWRWRTQDVIFKPRNFSAPQWDGRPLVGQTVLVHAEQGLGDTLMFVRYAALLRRQGCRVVLECQKPLQPLLSQCTGFDQLVARGDSPPPFDFHVPLMSLPGLLGTSGDNIPSDVPYLEARGDLVSRWRERLSDCTGYKIGICWCGSSLHINNSRRSFTLAQFATLAEVPGVRLISLQKGEGVEELAAVRFPVLTLGSDLDEASGAFMDTAAVMKNLDLVISTDSAVAHLAGGLGVPVWVALATVPDWRWLLNRDDSPWYPTMRLFRQEQAGDWDGVFRRMRQALQERLAARQTAEGLNIEVAPGELLDKLTILQIKSERIVEASKLANVHRELAVLTKACDRYVPRSAEIVQLTAKLKQVNEALWRIEDEIRACERRRDFGPDFVDLARSVYWQNDRRAALKRRINEVLGSRIVEEKSYQAYE